MKISKFTKSQRLPLKSIQIRDVFWEQRLSMNNNFAIFYQWNQLERTHNLDNFRILAGEKEGYRLGFFYCDSDLHKWIDAAARILTTTKNKKLSKKVQEYIDLMEKVQQEDGYLYTYNQFHFPDRRWANLQIEHELYCLGHMIEAAVSYMETNESDNYKKKFLAIATKTADLLVNVFQNTSPIKTPGHQEIEIALIRLYRLTKEKKYLDLAAHFINQRGKTRFFSWKLFRQFIDQNNRSKFIKEDMEKKGVDSDTGISFAMGEMKHQKEAPFLSLRSQFQFLSGRYHQQNLPVRKMRRPYGHAVRWGYLVTAMAMLYQETGDDSLLKALLQTWEHLVQKQMFITGGIGALGRVEGFGCDYELDSEYCYCETCAAVANILLNWELALITNNPKFSDLLEWQLYNALSVGIGLDGKSYLYRNLLESKGQLIRKPWFGTPCCPSNISRIWANIGEYIYSTNDNNIWIHQFIGNSTNVNIHGQPVELNMTSKLPWQGKIEINFHLTKPQEFTIHLRIPNWTDNPIISVNGKNQTLKYTKLDVPITGAGFSPKTAIFYSIAQKWDKTNTIEISFPMKINIHRAHRKVKANRGKVALSHGPLVYCFESQENPLVNSPNFNICTKQDIRPIFDSKLLGGVFKLHAKNKQGRKIIAIPYYCWANRKASAMKIWVYE